MSRTRTLNPKQQGSVWKFVSQTDPNSEILWHLPHAILNILYKCLAVRNRGICRQGISRRSWETYLRGQQKIKTTNLNTFGSQKNMKVVEKFIQTFHRIWCLKNVNFVKNEALKMWILWKMRLWKCEFWEKWDFQNLNFVKNEILKMWILWKLLCSKCEFLYNSGFLPHCENYQKNCHFLKWEFYSDFQTLCFFHKMASSVYLSLAFWGLTFQSYKSIFLDWWY